MFPWETLNIYSQLNSRWFEPLDRYRPDDTHLAVFRKLMPSGWAVRRRGLWFLAERSGAERPHQGWKLHVSAQTHQSAEVLAATLPILRDHGVLFKFLLDPRAVHWTTSKSWPRSAGGKFITIYPANDEVFRTLADELAKALDGFTGPYVLSDRRHRDSVVSYRYGGFTGIPQVGDDGISSMMIYAPDGTLVPDLRTPYWSAPEWITEDPFGRPVDDEEDQARRAAEGEVSEEQGDGLLGGRFQVEAALQFSNRGGVYLALDTQTGKEVILKEARPYVNVGRFRPGEPDIEYASILRKEYELLTLLSDTGHFVRPVALFTEWEHTFLAEERVHGPQFSQHALTINPVVTGEFTPQAMAAYHARIRDLLAQFVTAVHSAHQHGIVLGDLSWTNVLLDEETDRIVLIDLESAVRPGVDVDLAIFTPGVSSPRSIAAGQCAPADDYYALGRILFGSVMLLNSMLGFDPGAFDRLLTALSEDLGLPEDLVRLTRDLASEPGDVSPDAEELRRRFTELSVGDVSAWPQVLPLARPAAELIVGERADRLRTEVNSTLEGLVEALHGTATPQREDRLFPTDVAGFETNPMSVAYGAMGVLYALDKLPGQTPSSLLGWALRREVGTRAYSPGLYTGLGGIAWTFAELGHTDYAVRLMEDSRQAACGIDRPGVLSGLAGRGMACLKMWQLTGRQDFLDEAVHCGEHLTERARQDNRGAYWSAGSRTPGRVPLGYADGPSGVALFLLYLHLATGLDQPLELGRRALGFELSQAVEMGANVVGFRGDLDPERDPACRCYWDMGTAGVLTTLTRYVAVTGEAELDGWVDRLLPDVSRKYTALPQLFHGLAGLGNVLLDVAELTGRPQAVAEAWRTAEGALLFALDRPEGICFPGEQARRESADFATGAAGVGLFLNRLVQLPEDPATSRSNFNFVLDDLLPER